MMTTNAEEVRNRLQLNRHPEGGWFREVYRSGMEVVHPTSGRPAERSALTAIHFLLEAWDFSAWHVVASDEVWHHAGGGAMEVTLMTADGAVSVHLLGAQLGEGEVPFVVVPAGAWQAARPAQGAAWSLVSCFVAPGFEFADFAMPGRGELLERFPDRRALIEQFTRAEGE